MPDNANQPPEGQRRRIVIPLNRDQPPPARSEAGQENRRSNATPGSPRKSRAGKVLAVLGIIIVAGVLLAAGAGFLGWRHYQTTPTYSLAVLVDAAQRNDMATVDQIVDMDKIVDNFAAQVADKAAGRYGVALSGEMRKVIEARVPGLLPTIKREVRDAVTARIKDISAKADQKPFFVIAVAMPYFVTVSMTGAETADVRLITQDREIVLGLSRSGDAWRLVSVRDDALVQQLVDQVIKDLPAIAPHIDLRKLGRPPSVLQIP